MNTDDVHAAMFFRRYSHAEGGELGQHAALVGFQLDFVCVADIYHSSVVDYVDLVLPCAASSSAPTAWAA